jgi:hypothetical protein
VDVLLTPCQILFAYEDERGEDVIEAMDFWKSQRRSEIPSAVVGSSYEKLGSLGSSAGYHSRV